MNGAGGGHRAGGLPLAGGGHRVRYHCQVAIPVPSSRRSKIKLARSNNSRSEKGSLTEYPLRDQTIQKTQMYAVRTEINPAAAAEAHGGIFSYNRVFRP